MKVNELLRENDEQKLDAWKEKVKKAHPEYAAKMKFKGRAEGGKDMICAEVPGMDRCFGVFDMDKLKGEVLGEALVLEAAIDTAKKKAADFLQTTPAQLEKVDAKMADRVFDSGKEVERDKVELGDGQHLYVRVFKAMQKYFVSIEAPKDVAGNVMYTAKNAALVGEALLEKRPAGAPKWHDSDAPDAKGKFRDLSIDDLADWLIKTRKGDMQKISGSLTQQIVFNRKKDPAYAKKMESVRAAVKRKLKKD